MSSKTADTPTKPEEVTDATRPEVRYQIFSVALFSVTYLLGLFFLGKQHPGLTHLPGVVKGTSVFAILYIYAQAIERLLVPVSWFGGGFLDGKTKLVTKSAVRRKRDLALSQPHPAAGASPDPQAIANAQHAVDQYRANLTATTFGVAAALAFVASGLSGALLLHIAGIDVAGWLDLLVTGVAVAGGTKPLHDLISNVSASAAAKS